MTHATFDTPPIRGQKHFGTGGTFHTWDIYERAPAANTVTTETVAVTPVAVAPVTEAVPLKAEQTTFL